MNNKVALITGSSRGIGKQIAIKFASNGYNVVINYKNSESDAIKLSKFIKENYNVDCICIKCDISLENNARLLINEVIEKFRRIDCLVNNAGICNDCSLFDKNRKSFIDILDTNLVAPFTLSKEAFKYLKENTNSSIINISSTNSSYSFYPESIDYDASKAALNSLTKNLAVEFSPYVRVNAVAPGWIDTDMNKEIDEQYKKEVENKCLLKKMGSAEEIANVVYFLASNDASYINGEIINVDGGHYGY